MGSDRQRVRRRTRRQRHLHVRRRRAAQRARLRQALRDDAAGRGGPAARSLGVERKPLNGHPSLEAALDARSRPSRTCPGMPRRPRHVVLVTVESLSARVPRRLRLEAGTDAEPRPPRPRRPPLRQRLRDRHAHGARARGGVARHAAGPRPGDRAPARQRAPVRRWASCSSTRASRPASSTAATAMFDNMNAYFEANDYRIVDRTDFPKASIVFENVWGVADESLFANALAVIDADAATGEPIFTHIMTTSNHRPFTYPDGRIADPLAGRTRGRRHVHRLGDRPASSRRRAHKPWFDDTLFVFVADHCAAVAGKTQAAGRGLPDPADPLRAEARRPGRLRRRGEPDRRPADAPRRAARRW